MNNTLGAYPSLSICVRNTVAQYSLSVACFCDPTSGTVLCNGACQPTSDVCTADNAAAEVNTCVANANAKALIRCNQLYLNYPCPLSGLSCSDSTLLRCPDGSCRPTLAACPSSLICPRNTPVRCPDSSCATSVTTCPGFSNCNNGLTLCGDGSCAASASQCNPLPYCPTSAPYLCFDSTCRATPNDCPPTPRCPLLTPFLCPNGGSCATTRAACNPAVSQQCTSDAPVKCADGNCYATVSMCTPSSQCPSTSIVCPDGSCRIQNSDCPAPTCPFYLPVQCPGGQCARSAAECITPPVCTLTGLSDALTCFDGTCTKDITTCTLNPTCNAFSYRCLDGLCTSSTLNCPSVITQDPAYACPVSTPFRCADGTCKILPDYCKVIQIGKGTQTCPQGFSLCPTGSLDYGRCVPASIGKVY